MSEPVILLRNFVDAFETSPLAFWTTSLPWELTAHAEAVVRQLVGTLDVGDFDVDGDVAIHKTATVEPGAVLKGPLVVGPHCFIAAGAYLRGGNWIAEHCTVGPGSELKSSFVFPRSNLAHFNFVGDSILGEDVNLEAGSVVCNHRNERANKEILVRLDNRLHRTGSQKFGALVGDHSSIGANAVLAPGTIVRPGVVVPRAALIDDEVMGV